MPITFEDGCYIVTVVGDRPSIRFPLASVNILRLPENVCRKYSRTRVSKPPLVVDLSDSDGDDDKDGDTAIGHSAEPHTYRKETWKKSNKFPTNPTTKLKLDTKPETAKIKKIWTRDGVSEKTKVKIPAEETSVKASSSKIPQNRTLNIIKPKIYENETSAKVKPKQLIESSNVTRPKISQNGTGTVINLKIPKIAPSLKAKSTEGNIVPPEKSSLVENVPSVKPPLVDKVSPVAGTSKVVKNIPPVKIKSKVVQNDNWLTEKQSKYRDPFTQRKILPNNIRTTEKVNVSEIEPPTKIKRKLPPSDLSSNKPKASKVVGNRPQVTALIPQAVHESPFTMPTLKLNKPFVIPRKPKAPTPERDPSPVSEDIPDFSRTRQRDNRDDLRTPSPPVISFEGESNSPLRVFVGNEPISADIGALLASPLDVRHFDPDSPLNDDTSPDSLLNNEMNPNSPLNNETSPGSPENDCSRSRSPSKSPSASPRDDAADQSKTVAIPSDDLDVLDLFADDNDFDF